MEFYILLPKQSIIYLFIFLDSLVQWSIKYCILAQSLQVWNTMFVLRDYVWSNSLLIQVAFAITYRKLIN